MDLAALVFDFDGLILDTETPAFRAWQQLYAELGLELSLSDWQTCIGTHGGFDPLVALGQRADDSQQRFRMLLRDSLEVEPLRPGVERLVRDARAAGLRLAVASSSARDWVEPWLRRHGLFEHFDALCTADDTTRVKPLPDLYLLALERLGVAADRTVALEDSMHGAMAAVAAGLRCIVVPNPMTADMRFPPECVVLPSLELTLSDLQACVKLPLRAPGG